MMTNKELIELLSGVSMKSEVEVVFEGKRLAVEKVSRLHIPEKEGEKGATIKARNIVQIVVKERPGSSAK